MCLVRSTSALFFAGLTFWVGPLSALDDLDPSQYSPQAVPSVPPGFRATLFASEPQIHNPAAIVFDDQGRLFVGYRQLQGELSLDCIKRL